MDKVPTIKLNSGTQIPAIGFGTWQLSEGREVEESVENALEAGYRLIDTAKIYDNENGVGKAIAGSKVPRSEIFLTTKLWDSDHGYDSALQAFDGSLSRLAQKYVDLYLIHWPGDDNVGSWKALIKLQELGKANSIGVSNFSSEDLSEIIDATGVIPSLNQIQLHPFVYQKQKPTIYFCNRHEILVEAYSPLSRGRNLNNQVVEEISKKHNKTSAQTVLRWSLQHSFVPIPKSSHAARIKQNIDIFGFELTTGEMDSLDNI